jgi:hypothetical protein
MFDSWCRIDSRIDLRIDVWVAVFGSLCYYRGVRAGARCARSYQAKISRLSHVVNVRFCSGAQYMPSKTYYLVVEREQDIN